MDWFTGARVTSTWWLKVLVSCREVNWRAAAGWAQYWPTVWTLKSHLLVNHVPYWQSSERGKHSHCVFAVHCPTSWPWSECYLSESPLGQLAQFFLSSSLVFFIFVTECTHTQTVSTKTHAGVYNRIKKKRKGKKWFIPEGLFSFCGPPAAHVCYNHRHHQSIVIGGDYCNAKKTRIWSMNRLSAW